MSHPRPLALLCAAFVVVGVAGCSDDEGSGDAIAITDTGSACEVAETELAAGPIAFEITNSGDQVTEVYVYAPGDKVVTEKENIGPGTKADLNVDLAAGEYEIACKPGMTGDGNRTEIHVTGEGGEALETTYDREVEFDGVDYAFEGLDDFTATIGEKIEFKMHNTGEQIHEFEVFGPDGDVLGEIGPTDPGEEGEVILTLADEGDYTYVCRIEDHEEQGMKGTFEVTAA